MSKIYFKNDLEQDAVSQIVERGHSADEVSKRMRVSQHSLYEWKKNEVPLAKSSRLTFSFQRALDPLLAAKGLLTNDIPTVSCYQEPCDDGTRCNRS